VESLPREILKAEVGWESIGDHPDDWDRDSREPTPGVLLGPEPLRGEPRPAYGREDAQIGQSLGRGYQGARPACLDSPDEFCNELLPVPGANPELDEGRQRDIAHFIIMCLDDTSKCPGDGRIAIRDRIDDEAGLSQSRSSQLSPHDAQDLATDRESVCLRQFIEPRP
jgi:hypothetical protein